MDPIETDNPFIAEFKPALLKELREKVSPEISVHDLRMVSGPTHTNLIFDILLPHNCPLSDTAVAKIATDYVRRLPGEYYAVVNVDQPYA